MLVRLPVLPTYNLLQTFVTDFLQDKLNKETSQRDFSDLPFRFVEISKVLLDVCVLLHGCLSLSPHTC